METQLKKASRPVENKIEPIKDTPERIAKSIIQAPPKKIWRYRKIDR